MPELTRIVVVSDEELFIEFMERFSPKSIQLLYAASLTEASQHCSNEALGLLVVPVDGQGQALGPLLTETACCDVRVLGLGDTDGLSEFPQVDRVAPAADHEAVFRAAAELLNERRSRPRVAYELTVEIGGMGSLVTSAISAVSLFVETSTPLEVDRRLKIRLRHGGRAPGGEATVVRVGLGESGNLGMVLAVTEESTDLRAFLEKMLREALRFEHRQQGAPDLPPAPVVEGPGARPKEREAAQGARQLQPQVETLARELLALRDLQQAGADELAQQLEQIQASNRDLDKLVQHHDKQVLALGGGLEQMVEHTANLDLTLKETAGALRRQQEQTQEQAKQSAGSNAGANEESAGTGEAGAGAGEAGAGAGEAGAGAVRRAGGPGQSIPHVRGAGCT